MTPTEISFAGLRSATAPLTWAQRAWWEQYRDGTAYLTVVRPAPPHATLERVTAAVRQLLGRHEALRTCYPPGDDGTPTQLLLGSGGCPLRLRVAIGPDVSGDAERLADDLMATPFDRERDVPVRVGIVTSDGRPSTVVLAISGYAVDCWSVPALDGDLAAALAGDDPAPLPRQPMQQAEFERSPGGQEVQARSLDYWRSELAHMPRTAFPVPPAQRSAARHRVCCFDSPATALACALLATRYRVSTGHLLLAGLAAVLGARSGTDGALLGLVVNNRMADPESIGAALLHMQEGVCAVPLGDLSFRELARLCRTKAMESFRYARYDPAARATLFDEIALVRGAAPTRSCVVNDTRQPATFLPGEAPETSRAELRRLVAATRVTWEDRCVDTAGVDLFVTVLNESRTASLAVLADTHQVSAADVEALLRGLETVVTEAVHRDVRLAEVGDLTDLQPPAALSGWTYVDHSWVDPRSVEGALRAATGASAVGVFAESDGGRRRLTAYLAGPEGARLTPRQVHRALVGTISTAPDTTAPQRYVVCATAPDEPDSPDAWRRQRVLAEGDGR
ncbi:condensation domain-containing protein [Micromonosporaceae bacterium B7E4]